MSDTPPPVPPSPVPVPPPSSGLTDRNWCTIIHASQFLVFVTGFGHILAPLLIWLVKRESSPAIDAAGRTVLNFQISFMIYTFVAGILCWVLIGFVLLPIILIAWLILMIIGTVKSSNGEDYTYPFTIKLL